MNPADQPAFQHGRRRHGGDGWARRPARRAPAPDRQRLLRPHRRPGVGLQVVRARRAAVRPAGEDILGQGFFETLIGGTLPPAGQAWRGFLDLGEPPRVPGTVQLTGRRGDGDEFPMEAVFVPVKLDEGFDFSLFLEDLSFELPMNLMLLRMRQQHPVVVRALKPALEPEAQPWEGWRTAGTLVVFRPLQATPWVEAELARREAERAAADAEAEERLTNIDPGIQGDFRDLDDAAAVVARLLSAVERIDELERVAGGLPAQLEEARREADQRAAEPTAPSDALRADIQRALAGVPSELDRHEQLARLERLERAPRRRRAPRSPPPRPPPRA